MVIPKNTTINIKNNCYCNNLIEIYRSCNLRYCYSLLMRKYSNQIIISDTWKQYYDEIMNKMHILTKLGKLSVNILKLLDKHSRNINILFT